MFLLEDGDDMTEYTLTQMSSDDETGLSDVLALAKAHSHTLGFLPDSAFRDRAHLGTLLIARGNDTLLGYCLFDLPRAGHIKLVHVCVAAEARGLQLGKMFIAKAIELNPMAIGVLAYCRRDYKMDRFWESAGLSPRNERAGRSSQGSILSTWWRQLGALDLLEEAALDSGLPLVVYDTNIVSDLYASSSVRRDDREASEGLNAGWLQAAVTLAVSPRVDIELDRIDDATERAAQRQRSQELTRLRSDRVDDGALVEDLRRRAGATALADDPSLSDDLSHVADSVGAGAEFLITNDQNLLEVARRILPGFTELRVVRPHKLIEIMLGRLDSPSYQSRLIESVDLEWVPATTVENLLEQHFLTHELNERARDFTRNLRTAMANYPQTTRALIDPTGRPWALLAERPEGADLVLDLFRVRRGAPATTTALQLARHVRSIARDNGLTRVRVTDQNIAPLVERALSLDRFSPASSGLSATVVDEVLEHDEIHRRYSIQAITPAQVRDAERRLWPLVVAGADVPAFVIPIRPHYAEPLFGLDRSVLWSADRKRALGLSREHVYFSSARSAFPTAQSRILWYVTSDKSGTERRIMARSRCLSTERIPTVEAHQRYGHIGVLSKREITEAGKDGEVTVVRFEDTEVLQIPVGGRALQTIFTENEVRGNILSFRKVSPRVFDEVVQHETRE